MGAYTMKTLTIGNGAQRAVLVHGNDLCAEFYVPLADQLAKRGFTTTLLTLPGFHHEPPLARPGWEGLVQALLEALPGPGTTLLGHSMGGLLALLAAARRPRELGTLVLLEPVLLPYRWMARAASRQYLEAVVRAERRRFVNWNGGQYRIAAPERYPPEMIELYLEVRRTSDRATAEALFSTLPALHPLPFERVEVPTLLVLGAETGLRSRAINAIVARRLRCRRVVIPEAAHWLANERDESVAEHTAEFVRAERSE